MKAHTSETIEITEGEKIAVVISEQENNAVKNDNGIFVKDNTSDIQANATAI
jgi:hypothetical protein